MSLARFKKDVAIVSEDDTVEHAAGVMRDRGVGCLVVKRHGRPSGIVTDRDLVIRVLAEGLDPTVCRLASFVTYDPITVSVVEGIETAAERMSLHGIRRLPIVDDRGDAIGIVTADDLLALLGGEIADICRSIEHPADSNDSR